MWVFETDHSEFFSEWQTYIMAILGLFKMTAAFHSVRQISLVALPPLRFPDLHRPVVGLGQSASKHGRRIFPHSTMRGLVCNGQLGQKWLWGSFAVTRSDTESIFQQQFGEYNGDDGSNSIYFESGTIVRLSHGRLVWNFLSWNWVLAGIIPFWIMLFILPGLYGLPLQLHNKVWSLIQCGEGIKEFFFKYFPHTSSLAGDLPQWLATFSISDTFSTKQIIFANTLSG